MNREKTSLEERWERITKGEEQPPERKHLRVGWHELAIDHAAQRFFADHRGLFFFIEGRVLRSTEATRVGKAFVYVFPIQRREEYRFYAAMMVGAAGSQAIARILDEARARLDLFDTDMLRFKQSQDTATAIDGVKVLANSFMVRTRDGRDVIRTEWVSS